MLFALLGAYPALSKLEILMDTVTTMHASQRTTALLCLALCLTLATVPAHSADRQSPSEIKVGISKSIFVDVPSVLVQIIAPSFNALTRECTGLNSHMVVGDDCFELCKKLERNEVQLVCFQ